MYKKKYLLGHQRLTSSATGKQWCQSKILSLHIEFYKKWYSRFLLTLMTKSTGYVDYRITYISVFIHFVKVKVNYARVQ